MASILSKIVHNPVYFAVHFAVHTVHPSTFQYECPYPALPGAGAVEFLHDLSLLWGRGSCLEMKDHVVLKTFDILQHYRIFFIVITTWSWRKKDRIECLRRIGRISGVNQEYIKSISGGKHQLFEKAKQSKWNYLKNKN